VKKKTTQAKPAKAFDPHNVSGEVLGEILGMTRQQVAALFRARTIPQNGKRGKYDLFTAVSLYVQSIKTSGTAEAGERLKIEQRRKIKLQNDVAAGLLVPIATIAAVIQESAASFLATWKAIPRRIAAELANESTPAGCRKLLETESDHARNELAGPIRKFYVDRGEALPDILADTLNGKQAPAAKPGAMGKRKQNSAKGKRRTRPVEK